MENDKIPGSVERGLASSEPVELAEASSVQLMRQVLESNDIGYDSEFNLLNDGGELGIAVHDDYETQQMLAKRCGYLTADSKSTD